MKLLTIEYIKSLDPCQSSLDNAIKHYNDLTINLNDFLDLDKISHQDKLWVFFRSIDKSLISKIAADFAEQVLHIYEDKYPNDLRPRKAIEAARSGDKDIAAANAAAYAAAFRTSAAAAANAAAYATYYAANAALVAADAAYYAAAAAAYATYYAANAALIAADAALNAAKTAVNAVAYYAVAVDAAVDAASKSMELKQIEIMKKYIKEYDL